MWLLAIWVGSRDILPINTTDEIGDGAGEVNTAERIFRHWMDIIICKCGYLILVIFTVATLLNTMWCYNVYFIKSNTNIIFNHGWCVFLVTDSTDISILYDRSKMIREQRSRIKSIEKCSISIWLFAWITELHVILYRFTFCCCCFSDNCRFQDR